LAKSQVRESFAPLFAVFDWFLFRERKAQTRAAAAIPAQGGRATLGSSRRHGRLPAASAFDEPLSGVVSSPQVDQGPPPGSVSAPVAHAALTASRHAGKGSGTNSGLLAAKLLG
jgi:hypothetical protein